jgi:hypothetical protein
MGFSPSPPRERRLTLENSLQTLSTFGTAVATSGIPYNKHPKIKKTTTCEAPNAQ